MKYALVALSLTSLIFLSACASIMEGSQQEITLKTPGEGNVVCYLDNGTLSYKLVSGDTKLVTKNYKDMQATCYAPGNRQKTFVVPWIIEPWTAGNIVNGVVPGVTYDVLTKSVYAYPDIVTVDFSDVMASANPLPDYSKYPVGGIEGYQAGFPTLPSEVGRETHPLRKKESSEMMGQSNPFGSSSDVTIYPAENFAGGSAYNPASEDK